jgi:PTS system ascorbate-specific IIA component
LAIPHAKVNVRGVLANGISFSKVARPVEFEPGNPRKNARLIFTLAANDLDGHYENMERLGYLLLNPEALKGLQEAEDLESVRALSKRLGL